MKHLLLSFLTLIVVYPFCYGQMTDQQLFDRINIKYPGLEQVRKAVERKDYEAAKEAYVTFLRNRKFPKNWLRNELPRDYPSNNRVSSKNPAERALVNEFEVLDVTYRFRDKIDWHFNPTDKAQNPNTKLPYKKEWTVQLNRFNFFQSLYRAFERTGNPIYAAKINELIDHWISNAPFKKPTRNNDFSTSWRTLEAGLRTEKHWPVAWVGTIRSKELKPETIIKWVKSWLQHGEYLSTNSGSLNWLTSESNGLFTITTLFPEFNQASAWQDLAVSRILGQAETDVYPDGSHVEITPGYHEITARNFAEIQSIAAKNGIAINGKLRDKTISMYDYLLKIMLPDRHMPTLNDTGQKGVNYLKALAKSEIPSLIDRPDNQWLISNGQKGTPPSFTSVQVPWAGQIVMRENWNKDANYLIFEYGPFGEGSHQHEDKLGVHIVGYGDLFVYEAGKEDYNKTAKRRYCKSSPAHSVITIDNLGQSRKEIDKLHRADSPYEAHWSQTDLFNYASGTYGKLADEKYGDQLTDLGIWRRHVLYLKPDVFLIMDALEPNDNRVHTYHSHFHLNANSVNVDNSTQSVSIQANGRPNFSLTPLVKDGLEIEVFKGSNNPMLGWEFNASNSDRKIPTIRYEKKGKGKIDFAYVFNTAPIGQPLKNPTIEQLDTPEDVFGVTVSNALSGNKSFQVLVTTDENQGSIVWEGIKYDTKAILFFEERVYDLITGQIIQSSRPSGDNDSEEEDQNDAEEKDEGNADVVCTDKYALVSPDLTIDQSSVALEGLARKAIDDNYNTTIITDLEENPWWSIDLGSTYVLKELTVFKSKDCYDYNLKDYYVFLSQEPFQSEELEVTKNQQGVTSYKFSSSYFFNGNVIDSIADIRYVRIQAVGKGSLNFDEIEILGCQGNANNNSDEESFETQWLEAECGALGKEWKKGINNDASNAQYIYVPDYKSFGEAPPNKDELITSYTFRTNKPGKYWIFLRALAAGLGDDSFWIKVNDQEWIKYNYIPLDPTSFQWNPVENTDKYNETVVFNLPAGDNTLKIALREDNTKLDKICIANVPEFPAAEESKATACSSLVEDDGIGKRTLSPEGVSVFPNPVVEKIVVNINSDKVRSLIKNRGLIEVYDNYGQKIYQSEEEITGTSIVIPTTGWSAGIYYVNVKLDNYEESFKIIKAQ